MIIYIPNIRMRSDSQKSSSANSEKETSAAPAAGVTQYCTIYGYT